MYVFSWPYRTKNLERSLVTVFVKDNRALISDFHVSQDIIVSDFEGCQILIAILILKQNSN